MRQPNEKNCSSVSHRDSARNTPPEKKNPIGAPSCGNIPYHARFPGGAFSIARSTAPPHSPPSPRPWPKRQIASRSGAANADRLRRSAARRSRPWKCPSSAARRRASSCGRCGRRSGRRAPSRPAGPGTRSQTSRATRAWPRRDRRPERTAAERRAPRRSRRCRSRRTRSSCRSGWQTAPGAAC